MTLELRAISALFACLCIAVLPLSATAQDLILRPHFISGATPEIQVVGNTNATRPATDAYRMAVQTTAQVRCMLEEAGTGRTLSEDERTRALMGASLRVTQLRGGAVPFNRTGDGPHVYFPTRPARAYFECTATPLPSDIATGGTNLLIEPATTAAETIKLAFTRPGTREPISNISVDEPFELQIHAFEENRRTAVEPPEARIQWYDEKETACTGRAIPNVDMNPPRAWQRLTGTSYTTRITRPGLTTACVSFKQPNGLFTDPIFKTIDVEPYGKPVELVDMIVVEADASGYIEADGLDRYTVRLTLRDTIPGLVYITVANQTEKATARLKQSSPGLGVYEAKLRYSDGLQIIKAEIENRSRIQFHTINAIASKEFLGRDQRKDFHSGAHLYMTNDVLEDSGTTELSTMRSLEALVKVIPEEDLAALFPVSAFSEQIETLPAYWSGRRPGWGRYVISQNTKQYATAVRASLTRDNNMTLRVEADLTREIGYTCYNSIGASINRRCFFERTKDTDFDAKFSITLEGPVKIITRDRDGIRYLVIDWRLWTFSSSDVSVTANRPLRDSGWRAFVENRIKNGLTKSRIERILGETNQLTEFQQWGRTFFGIPLMDFQGLNVDFALPKPFANGDVQMTVPLRNLQAELGGDFAEAEVATIARRVNLGGQSTRKDIPRADFNFAPRPDRTAILTTPTAGGTDPIPNIAVAAHLDMINIGLAHYFDAQPFDVTMTPPELVALLTPKEPDQSDADYEAALRNSALGALMAFPNGRVSLKFEAAPRLAVRDDNDRRLSLEIGPAIVVMDLDTRTTDKPKLVARLSGIIGVVILPPRPGPDGVRSGLRLNSDFNVCLVTPSRLDRLRSCFSDLGIEIIEARGYPQIDTLPFQSNPADQALLRARYDSLFEGLGYLETDRTDITAFLDELLRKALLGRFATETSPTLLPIDIELPDIPLSLEGPLDTAFGLNIPLNFTIRDLRPNDAIRGPFSGSRAWIGLEGFLD